MRLFAHSLVVSFALCLALGGGVGLAACAEDGGGESTSQKRIALVVNVASPAEARAPFVNAYQWTISLTKAEMALGAMYFFDGEPIFSHRTKTTRERLASLFVGTAYAHPGHYLAGNAVGQMLTSSSFSLLGDTATVGSGDGVSGLFRSARVTFSETVSGAFAGDLGGKIALFEGTAQKAGKTVGFRVSAVRAELLDADGQARVEGVTVLPGTNVGGDATIQLTIDPRRFFDQCEFDGLTEGTAPVDLPAGSDAAVNFVRGLKSGPAYVFTVQL